jgi:hypothetical protein
MSANACLTSSAMFSSRQRGQTRRATAVDFTSTGGGIGAALKAASIAVGGGSKLIQSRDPTFLSLRAAIDALADSLQSAVTAAATSDASWTSVATSHAAFSEAVAAATRATKAPSMVKRPHKEDDEDDAVAGAARFARAVADNAGPGPAGCKSTLHYNSLDQVHRFVEHLRGMQDRVKEMSKAHTDFVGAEGKLRTFEAKAAQTQMVPNAEIAARLTEKRDLAEKMYVAMVGRLIERMRAALDKKELVLTILRSAFWLQQARLHEALGTTQQPSTDAARATEPLLVSVNIMAGLHPPSSMYTALNPRFQVDTTQTTTGTA